MTVGLGNKLKIASVQEVLATRARATFSHRINFDTVGYETLPLMKQWCEQNCEDIWRCEQVHAIYFQFAGEQDATMFMLRWGGASGNKLK
jgi:hypothetical protein